VTKIFAEPPEGLDEEWTHGALIGGMCGWCGDRELAESYFRAAGLLVVDILAGRERGQDLVSPVMYLYRHGIELYLKHIVQPPERNHNLGSLLEGFCTHIRSRYNEKVPVWITRTVSELADFDPGSDLFRYGETKPIKRSLRVANHGEFWVDLRAIRKDMDRIAEAFRRVAIADETGEIPLARPRRHPASDAGG
jgi:hypothetical protein